MLCCFTADTHQTEPEEHVKFTRIILPKIPCVLLRKYYIKMYHNYVFSPEEYINLAF